MATGEPLLLLGHSNQMPFLLIAAHSPLRQKAGPITKTVKTRPEGASAELQDCFERTNWGIFEHQDLKECNTTVLRHIKNSADIDIVDRCFLGVAQSETMGDKRSPDPVEGQK